MGFVGNVGPTPKIKADDILVVYKLDQLGRTINQLGRTINQLVNLMLKMDTLKKKYVNQQEFPKLLFVDILKEMKN